MVPGKLQHPCPVVSGGQAADGSQEQRAVRCQPGEELAVCSLPLLAAAVHPHCRPMKHPVPAVNTSVLLCQLTPICALLPPPRRYDRELGAFVVRLPNGQEDFLLDAAVGAGCLILAGSLLANCVTGCWKHQQVATYTAVPTVPVTSLA